MAGVPYPYEFKHSRVEAEQTNVLIPGTGPKTYLHRIIVTVTDNNHGGVTISHDDHTHLLVPGSAGVGVYNIEMNVTSGETGWRATTGHQTELIAVFTNIP